MFGLWPAYEDGGRGDYNEERADGLPALFR
jgi:hypothetical protein